MTTDATELMKLVERHAVAQAEAKAATEEAVEIWSEIKRTCHHPITVKKISSTSGGYDYVGQDKTWDECTICGHVANLVVVSTGHA